MLSCRVFLVTACLLCRSVVSDSSWFYVLWSPRLRSMGFPRQEYWNGLPFPSSEDLSNSGIKPKSLALAGSYFTTEPQEKPFLCLLFSHSVMSNSLQPHRLQHTRLPCPSPTPRACSNSRLLNFPPFISRHIYRPSVEPGSHLPELLWPLWSGPLISEN